MSAYGVAASAQKHNVSDTSALTLHILCCFHAIAQLLYLYYTAGCKLICYSVFPGTSGLYCN